ncbi:hypothetical protein N7537_001958 [Penicillium hordei]|uniref:PKD domain-containing protein n=1 Tax=Penicillium hordei TaxID=40994 RepID=A0AAD6H944_9EURO|nr:uncharacterized protein N7537_001958 [Penicillium hordei]KAJ5616844.1 hypothetical protein N7537_001958 [Penicillium hordei]
MGPVEPAVQYRLIDFTGLYEQHLRDLSAWVEKDIEPPTATNYTVQNGQVYVPQYASQRAGIQPVANLEVRDGTVAEAQVGSPVTLQTGFEVSRGVGKIVSLEWDINGNGTFVLEDFGAPSLVAQTNIIHVYTEPGVYFPSIRVASHRSGDAESPYAVAYNLGRAKVVVK